MNFLLDNNHKGRRLKFNRHNVQKWWRTQSLKSPWIKKAYWTSYIVNWIIIIAVTASFAVFAVKNRSIKPTPVTPCISNIPYSPNNPVIEKKPNPKLHWAFFCFGVGGNKSGNNSISYTTTSATTSTLKTKQSVLQTFTNKYAPLQGFKGNGNVRDPYVSCLPNHTKFFPKSDYLYFISYTMSPAFTASPTSLGLACTPDFKQFIFIKKGGEDKIKFHSQKPIGVDVMDRQYLDYKSHLDEAKNSSLNVWAPKMLWSRAEQKYIIYWSSTIPGLFPDTDNTGDPSASGSKILFNHRFFYTSSSDLSTFSQTALLYNGEDSVNLTVDQNGAASGKGGYDMIDINIFYNPTDNNWIIFYKNESKKPIKKFINSVVSQRNSANLPFSPALFSPSSGADVTTKSISEESKNLDEGPDVIIAPQAGKTQKSLFRYVMIADNFTNKTKKVYDYFENTITPYSTHWHFSEDLFNFAKPELGHVEHGSLVQLSELAFKFLNKE